MWLIPGILLAPIFVVLIASVHAWAPEPMKVVSRIGLPFAVAYAVVIGADVKTTRQLSLWLRLRLPG